MRPPPLIRAVAPPLLTAAAVGVAWSVVAAVDPNVAGRYGFCPMLSLTGLNCPLCGGLRSAHALAQGELLLALDRNALFVLALPLLAAVWVRWLALRGRGATAAPLPRPERWVAAGLGVLLLFAVVRNLPAGAWLLA